MQLPMAYLDAVAIEEVPVELWERIFERAGWPPSLDRTDVRPPTILGKVFMAQRKVDKGREHLERAKAVFGELSLPERVAMVDKELRLAKV